MSFQSAKGVSSTGYVGPLTRAAVAAVSCGTASVSSQAAVQNIAPVAPSVSVSSNITAPLSGANLLIGQTYTIAWNGASQSGYSIVLENQNGLSQGFITPNSQISNSYNWQVGTVLSSVTNAYSIVAPGTYRIHLESVSSGSPDMYSGNFTISAPPLSVSAVMPTTISLSNNRTLAIYGSGLNYSVSLNIDGSYTLSGSPLYASPDGTIAVFSLPSSVPPGIYAGIVSNSYGSIVASPAFTVTQ
jgi:hypothetical protein